MTNHQDDNRMIIGIEDARKAGHQVRVWSRDYQLVWDSATLAEDDVLDADVMTEEWVNVTVDYAQGGRWSGRIDGTTKRSPVRLDARHDYEFLNKTVWPKEWILT